MRKKPKPHYKVRLPGAKPGEVREITVDRGYTLDEIKLAQAAIEKARNSTPAVLLGAFPAPLDTLGNLTLLAPVASHWMSLEKLGSPFIRDGAKDEGIATDDIFAALYVLTTDGAAIWADASVPDPARRVAGINAKIAAIANVFPAPSGWKQRAIDAIERHLAGTVSTVIATRAPAGGETPADTPPGDGLPLANSQPPRSGAAG